MLKPLLPLTLAAALAGCCNQNPGGVDLRTLPPPISLQEQVARLDARSAALPRIKAIAALRGVELRWIEKGQQKVENFEGTLLLRQSTEGSGAGGGGSGAEIQLSGRAFDQEVLLAGKNATDWWCIVRLDVKKAWTGDARAPIHWTHLATPHAGDPNAALLRVDPIPDLLGLTQLANAGRDHALVFRVDDFNGTNDVLVEDLSAAALGSAEDGNAWIRREIVVDRRTGDISEVRLYDPEGIMAVRSQLSDYRPVTVADAPPSESAPRMPFRIRIDYPAQQTTVTLQFEKITVPARINDAAFETPDFTGQGLQVIHVK
jgi:hypothetical protein